MFVAFFFLPFYKVPVRQSKGDLEKGYTSFFLTFFISQLLLSATSSHRVLFGTSKL